jgi:hypothetical protein
MNPNLPARLIGAQGMDLFGQGVTTGSREIDVDVDLPGGRAEFHVRCSPLIDRRHRSLGKVYVARGVT